MSDDPRGNTLTRWQDNPIHSINTLENENDCIVYNVRYLKSNIDNNLMILPYSWGIFRGDLLFKGFDLQKFLMILKYDHTIQIPDPLVQLHLEIRTRPLLQDYDGNIIILEKHAVIHTILYINAMYDKLFGHLQPVLSVIYR